MHVRWFILSGPEVGFRLMEELLRRGAYFTNMFHVVAASLF